MRVAGSGAGAGGAAERGGGAVGAESPELRASRRAVGGGGARGEESVRVRRGADGAES